MLNEITRAVSNPTSSLSRLSSVRMKSAAPASSNKETATCEATRPLRNRACPPSTLPACSFSVGAMRGRMDCSAGARPNNTPVIVDTPNVNARIRQSGAVEIGCGVSGLVKNARTIGAPIAAIPRPTAPPARARTTLSTISCEQMRPRLAPSARRTAISRWRDAPRATNRFATLAHAISRTPAAVAINTHNGVVIVSRNRDRPCEASETVR